MSIQAMAWVLDHSESEHADRLVLLSIANRVNDDTGFAWPSLALIARESRLSRSTVIQSIKRLEAMGELIVERTKKKSKEAKDGDEATLNEVNHYWVPCGKGVVVDSDHVVRSGAGVARSAAKGGPRIGPNPLGNQKGTAGASQQPVDYGHPECPDCMQPAPYHGTVETPDGFVYCPRRDSA